MYYERQTGRPQFLQQKMIWHTNWPLYNGQYIAWICIVHTFIKVYINVYEHSCYFLSAALGLIILSCVRTLIHIMITSHMTYVTLLLDSIWFQRHLATVLSTCTKSSSSVTKQFRRVGYICRTVSWPVAFVGGPGPYLYLDGVAATSLKNAFPINQPCFFFWWS